MSIFKGKKNLLLSCIAFMTLFLSLNIYSTNQALCIAAKNKCMLLNPNSWACACSGYVNKKSVLGLGNGSTCMATLTLTQNKIKAKCDKEGYSSQQCSQMAQTADCVCRCDS